MLRRTFTTKALSAATAAKYPFLAELGIEDVNAGCYDGKEWKASGAMQKAYTPITGEELGPVVQNASLEDTQRCIKNMTAAKAAWAKVPAPKRGEVVRQIGDKLREKLHPLGQLLSLEMGKILPEGKGEIQEYVDVCDFATGLSRQIPGQVLPSERPDHFMMEQWHPLGAIGIICAFNFPVAVAGWNTSISMVAGNTQIWKAAPTTPLVSIATQKIMTDVILANGLDGAISTFVCGGADIGDTIVNSRDVPLISFTGSTAVGREINKKVAARFGKPLLELGGNNAIFIMDDANVEMAVRASLFGSVGTAGQRCTTCRRLYIHESLYDTVVDKMSSLYKKLKIGNPLEEGVLVGPLHTMSAVEKFEATIAAAKEQGGRVIVGGERQAGAPSAHYVQPTMIAIDHSAPVVRKEAFVPILYVMKFKTIEEAIQLNNEAEEGLSAAMFTNNLRNIMQWTGPTGADTGIANVNIPTNGAEIGGAFGGEKATGGGRESGSDAWKQYMRRQTNTINYGTALPLAQGINFDV